MAGNRYQCSVCAAVAWLRGPGLCVNAACLGRMLPAPKRSALDPRPCQRCGRLFTPKHGRQRVCSGDCSSQERRERQAAESRKRYAARKAGVSAAHPQAWSWLEPCFAEDGFHHEGKRTLLRRDDYPWHDVLAGNIPNTIDECPFL